MKRKVVKMMALVLSLVLIATVFVGCGGDGETKIDETAGFTVTFPKPMNKNEASVEATYERWKKMSDVPVEFNLLNSDGAAEKIKLQFSTGDYPEVILGNLLSTTDVSNYAANGILVPLDEYINEKDTPNIYKLFQEHPEVAAANKLPDGHMYSMMQYNDFGPEYLENVMFINKVWLDKLNLEVPTTIDELLEVLRAFKTGDPNGNGEADEIPVTFRNGHGFSYPEALLSCWGVATKHGTWDNFCTVQDGVVKFAPMMDEWKEMIKFYRTLYAEGLLDMECFTHHQDTFNAKLSADVSKIGFVWSASNPMKNAEEYIAIPPLTVGDITPVWRIHPGIIGNRNVFSITTACKNPKAVMKWIDNFYNMDVFLENQYGPIGTVFTVDDNGMYCFNEPYEGLSWDAFTSANRVISGPGAFFADQIGTKVEMTDSWEASMENYALYEPFLDKETWPRPYYSSEETTEMGKLTTDIFSLVDEKKAKWIVGTSDIDAEWEDYKKNLEAIGVKDLLKINQAAYDRFQNGLK